MEIEKIIKKLSELKSSLEKLKNQHHSKGKDKFESYRDLIKRIIDRIYPAKDAKELKDKLVHKSWIITGKETDEYWQEFYLIKIDLAIRVINTIFGESELFGLEDFENKKEKTETKGQSHSQKAGRDISMAGRDIHYHSSKE